MAGNVIDWTHAKWEVINMKSFDLNIESMCNRNILGPVLFSELQTMQKSLELCDQLFGNMYVIGTQDAKQTAMSLLSRTEKCSLTVWAGWWDIEDEGKYLSVDKSTDKLEDFELKPNWAPGEPNGDTYENCAAMVNGQFKDYFCEKMFCTICYVGYHPTFFVRGRLLIFTLQCT